MWGKVLGASRTPAVAAIACCCGILAAGASLFFYHKHEERKRATKRGDGLTQHGHDDLLKEWKQEFARKKEREEELLLRKETNLWWAPTDQGPTYLELDKQFTMSKTIGCGGYGVVVAAWDKKKNKKVAIKKVASAFDDTLVAKSTIREIRLLQQLEHPNIIRLLDVLPPPSVGQFRDVYMVLERMETDLSNMIIDRGHNLNEAHFQSIMYQILCGVSYMHSAKVIHRDLKPENVLINRNGDVKICDFGLARTHANLSDATEYVVTRWWRAPEVLLGTNYGMAIDVWSAGCIMAEMLQREPLFMGSDTAEMLRLVVQFTGKPSEADLSSVTSQKTRNYVLDMTEGPRIPLPERFPGVGPDAIDLISRMLEFSPARRISVRDAMRHHWFSRLYKDDDETPAPRPADLAAVENLPLTRPNLQQLMFQEVCIFRPECRAMAPGGT